MKPESAPSESTEILHRVRQQLILAQVRIMELEDVRDDLTGKWDDVKKLLFAAQQLADQKVDEAGHLARVREELQSQFEHMRHMQHVTNEALNSVRSQLASVEQDRGRLQQKIIALIDQASSLNNNVARLTAELAESNGNATTQLERSNRLDVEIRQMKATRLWRWTAWLRSDKPSPGEK